MNQMTTGNFSENANLVKDSGQMCLEISLSFNYLLMQMFDAHPCVENNRPPHVTSSTRAGNRRALIRTQRVEKVTSTPIQPYQPAHDMRWPMSPQSTPAYSSTPQYNPTNQLMTNVSTAHNAQSSSPLKMQVTPFRVNVSLLTRDWYHLPF